jgi:hypothetical protein
MIDLLSVKSLLARSSSLAPERRANTSVFKPCVEENSHLQSPARHNNFKANTASPKTHMFPQSILHQGEDWDSSRSASNLSTSRFLSAHLRSGKTIWLAYYE